MTNDIVVLGRLAEPYGIRGWFRLHVFGDDPLSWREIPVWYLGPEGGPWREFSLRGLKSHGDGFLIAFTGVDDRTAAESLQGLFVGVLPESLPATADNEFYWADLLGLQVVNRTGVVLGVVDGLIETGANDVLRVVDGEGHERLLPFVDPVVIAVDRPAGQILVEWESDW